MERGETITDLSPGQPVLARNDFGDVRARFGGYEGKLEVLAVLQQFASEGAPLEVKLHDADGAMLVDVGYQDDNGERITRHTEGQRRRVDLVLLVPEGSSLDVQTSKGLVQLRGLHSDVRARTDAGEIQVRSIKGNVDVASQSGQLFVALPASENVETQRIGSESGDVRLMLSEDGHFRIETRGDGLISTEFPIEISTTEDGERAARIEAGKGITPVAVRAGRGHLRIERKPSAQLAADFSGEGS
jgi:hypothetical protein